MNRPEQSLSACSSLRLQFHHDGVDTLPRFTLPDNLDSPTLRVEQEEVSSVPVQVPLSLCRPIACVRTRNMARPA